MGQNAFGKECVRPLPNWSTFSAPVNYYLHELLHLEPKVLPDNSFQKLKKKYLVQIARFLVVFRSGHFPNTSKRFFPLILSQTER